MEACAFGFFHGVDELVPKRNVRAFRSKQPQPFVSDGPVRATIKVLQGNVHAVTVNLAVNCKVKG